MKLNTFLLATTTGGSMQPHVTHIIVSQWLWLAIPLIENIASITVMRDVCCPYFQNYADIEMAKLKLIIICVVGKTRRFFYCNNHIIQMFLFLELLYILCIETNVMRMRCFSDAYKPTYRRQGLIGLSS